METVNRILQEKITERIAPNKAVLIFGARRVGKTVMMRKIVDNYSGRTMMLNGEDYDTLAPVSYTHLDVYKRQGQFPVCVALRSGEQHLHADRTYHDYRPACQDSDPAYRIRR